MRNRSTTALLMATIFAVSSAEAAKVISGDNAKKLLIIIEADFMRLLNGDGPFGMEDQKLTGDNPIAVEFNKYVTSIIDRNDPDHVVPKGYTE